MQNVDVFSAPLPFSNKQEHVTFLEGLTIQEIVEKACPVRSGSLGAVVFINDNVIPRKYWHRVRPKAGTLVNIRVVPGKGGGKKNPLTTLLSIAVMIAAPYVGAALGSTIGFGGLWVGSTFFSSATIYSAAFGIVGKMLISSLAPPPKPSNAGNANVSNAASSPTQFIEGARNGFNPYGVIPICLGTNRMFPLQAAKTFTETKNNDQFVRQLFTYGYGTKMQISDIKIGDTSITEFDEFELEHRLEGNLHEPTSIYPQDVQQEDMSVLLQQTDGFTTRTTAQDIDEAVVDVTFPRGLCSYNREGKRGSYRVACEIQFALNGVSPQVWSPGASAYSDFSGAVINIPNAFYEGQPVGGSIGSFGSRTDTIVINKYSGVISLVRGENGHQAPQPIPSNSYRLATVEVVTIRETNGTLTTTTKMVDNRSSSWFGADFETSSDFAPTKTGPLQITIAAGAIKFNDLDISGNQTEALRRSVRVVFPERGTYDIRIKRLSSDTASDQIFDKVYLTAIKSIRHEPPVNLQGLNGSAVLIKATEQLNGALEEFNVIASNIIPEYFIGTDTWEDAITSNPASLYRYVLQCDANAAPLTDDEINISDLEAWHTICVEKGYTYNRVIDYEASLDDILRDIASAGAASPAIVDGKRTVVVDKIKEDIVQIVTPRNSFGYSGEMIYNDIPHAFRVQFRNKEKGYQQDERIVYDDGYSIDNATKFESLELMSCTDADLAFKTARRHIATARLRPEQHTFSMDIENLVFLRGDRIKFVHDVPIIGIGDGRIKSVQTDNGSPELVTGITLDDNIPIPSLSTYYVRIRKSDGSQLYKQINVSSAGDTKVLLFTEPFDIADTPEVGDLCYVVEAGDELDLIITRIEPQDDFTAKITAQDYAPAIFDAENSIIPSFDSKITTPLEFLRPIPPQLVNIQSDEAVMMVNSDGSFLTRAVLTFQNLNENTVDIFVKVRVTGTTAFQNATTMEKTPERTSIINLQDGVRYDIRVWYKRLGGKYSLPLEINNYLFVGASGIPTNPTGFLVDIVGETSFFKWDPSVDIDHSHWVLKYSPLFSGATPETALVVEDKIFENRFVTPFRGGTYFLIAVDRTDNECEIPATIITFEDATANAVETLNEHPDWSGTFDNVVVQGETIVMQDTSLGVGYYYFANSVDLTALFPAFVSASVVANGTFVNNIFEFDDVFEEDDIFGVGQSDIMLEEDIFAMTDVFGIAPDSWAVKMQYRILTANPSGSPQDWSDWADLSAGTIEFWEIEFRLELRSLSQNISPAVSLLSVVVDMPDRIERGEDLTVPAAGTTITYDPAFKNSPSVQITLQNALATDKIVFTSKTASGFSFRVYNETTMEYVERIYDYLVSGYGRMTT